VRAQARARSRARWLARRRASRAWSVRVWRRWWPMVTPGAGLAAFTGAAWRVSTVLGLVVLGVALFAVDWYAGSEEIERRRGRR